MKNYRFETAETPETFLALGSEWNELLAESNVCHNVFLTWEWLSNWRANFGEGGRPCVWLAREADSGRLVGAAPLLRQWRKLKGALPYREVVFMGSGIAAADHLDVVIRSGHEAALTEAFVRWVLGNQSDLLNLEGMAAKSAVIPCLLERTPPQARLMSHNVCPTLALPADWETFQARLGGNLRRNIIRYNRYLERDTGAVPEFKQVTEAAEIEAGMPTLFRLHQAVRQARGDAGSFSDERMVRFHMALAQVFGQRGWLRLYTMGVAGEIVAVTYNFFFGDKVFYYSTGYDEGWNRYGPGRQLMAYTIQRAIEEGACEFDFLRGEESYKSDWSGATRKDVNLTVATSALGRLVVRLKKAREKAKEEERVKGDPTDAEAP